MIRDEIIISKQNRRASKGDQQPATITVARKGGKNLKIKLYIDIKFLLEYLLCKYYIGVNHWHGLPMENYHTTVLLSIVCHLYSYIALCEKRLHSKTTLKNMPTSTPQLTLSSVCNR